MLRKGVVALTTLCMIILIVGCASIVSKSSYQVTINSHPDQADITVMDQTGYVYYSGKTPATIMLNTKKGYFQGKDYTVTFSKNGYAPHKAQIRRGVDAWYLVGNLLIGGLIGWLIVDPATGAMWTLEKEMNVALSKQTSSISNETGLRVVSIDDVPNHLRSKLIRID